MYLAGRLFFLIAFLVFAPFRHHRYRHTFIHVSPVRITCVLQLSSVTNARLILEGKQSASGRRVIRVPRCSSETHDGVGERRDFYRPSPTTKHTTVITLRSVFTDPPDVSAGDHHRPPPNDPSKSNKHAEVWHRNDTAVRVRPGGHVRLRRCCRTIPCLGLTSRLPTRTGWRWEPITGRSPERLNPVSNRRISSEFGQFRRTKVFVSIQLQLRFRSSRTKLKH